MKKHLSLLLCLLMLVSMFSVFTVQSSAAAAPVIMEFDSPETVCSNGHTYTKEKYVAGYINTFYWNNGKLLTRGTGTSGYDAAENAVWISGPSNGSTFYSARAYMLNYGEAFKTQDYKYVKVRVKAETPSNSTLTIALQTGDRGSTTANPLGYKNIPIASGYKTADGWIEKVIDLTTTDWYKSNQTVHQSVDGSNSDEAFFILFQGTSTVLKNTNFKGYVQYIAFFNTKEEADAYTYEKKEADPIVWTYDTHDAVGAMSLNKTEGYVSSATVGDKTTTNFVTAYDRIAQTVTFTPNYADASKADRPDLLRIKLKTVEQTFDGKDYPYVKIGYKLESDGVTRYRVAFRNTKRNYNMVFNGGDKINQWNDVVVDMASVQPTWDTHVGWARTTITPADYLMLTVEHLDKTSIYNDKDFNLSIRYIAFFATKEEAEAYTYTAPAVSKADPIIWRFDTFNAVKEYATDLNDAYIGAVGTTPTIVDFDEATKSVFLTPNPAGEGGNAMHVYLYNQAEAFSGKDYPFIKIGYRLQCAESDKYWVYFRNGAWSTGSWIDSAAQNGDWKEAIVDMGSVAHDAANKYWYNTTIRDCDTITSGNKWDLLLQIQNTAGKNILADKDFRFDIQYIAFFATEEEANDYIYTEPGATPVVSAVEMKLDNPNALKTHTDNTADLGAFYVSDYVVGDKGATYAPTGIMGYDADERAVYFTPDYYLNNRVANPYMSRVTITPKSKTFSGAEYRYVKLRYKLVTDDPNVRMFLRDAGTWDEFDIHADKKTPINQWVEVVVDLWNAGSGWTAKTISPEKGLLLQLSNNDKTVDNYDKDNYRLYLQYISFFQTKEEADAYTYTPTAFTTKPTGKSVVLPFDLPKYSYTLGGNRYTAAYSVVSHSMGADNKGAIAYDETEKAIYITPSEKLADKEATQSRFIIRGITADQIKGADYPYVQICYKLTNYTPAEGEIIALRDNKWVTYRLTEEPLKTGEWVTVTARMSALSSGANWKNAIFGASTTGAQNDLRIQLYCDNASTNITANPDARFYLKYVAFFQTQAEAEAFTYTAQPENPAVDPIVWKFDNHNAVKASASTLGKAYVSTAKTANGSVPFAYDKTEKAVAIMPSGTGNSYYLQVSLNNNDAAFAGKDYPVGKIRFKIEGDAAETYRVNFRSAEWSTHPIASSVKPGEWVEVIFDLTLLQNTTARQWFNTVVPDSGATDSKYGAILQVENSAGHNIYDDKNFRVCLQYLGFFPSEAAAKAYTYTAPVTETGDAILWKFDTYNAVPAYALDLSDAYIPNVGGSSTIVDFDEKTQSVTLTPNYGGTSGTYMHVQMYNSADEIKGEKYPYVKIRYRLQCEDSDSYLIYFRNNAWSLNYIDKAAKNGDWVEVVVDMTADAQSNANRYWFNTGVTNCDDPNAAAKWGLLLQIENTSGTGKNNIHDDKNFRFDLQYIGFFSTEEEANAYTYTAPAVSAVPPVVMKFDTPNASSTITTETDYLSSFYASNILMGDKNASGSWPIGIMGYDAQERSLYFVNDAAYNGKYPAPYMSRIYISSKNTAVQAEDYRYMKIRYKLVSDDPNVRVFLRDSKTWGSFDLFADRKTPVNEWVEVVVDLWKAGAGWNTKTLITPSNPLYLQLSNNNTAVNNYDKDDYRIYLQYISFFATEEEANAYTYTATDIGSLPNADDYKPTEKAIVMPFDLPKYSYNLAGNRYLYEYAIANNGFSFGADNKGNIKFDEVERAIYTEPSEALESATQARFVIRGPKKFSGADYPYVTICYKIENYEFGKNDYLTFRCGSAWTTIKLSSAPLVADQWVTATFNLNSMPGGAAWPNVQIGGSAGTTDYDLRLQLYLNKPGTDNFTSNPDTRFYLKYIAFFQTQADAEAFDYAEWNKPAEEETDIAADPWLQVLANKYAQKYTLTASTTEGGTITNIGTTQVKYKKDITYTIKAEEGYTLTDVLVDGKSVGAVTEYTFDNVKKAHTIHAVFTANAVEEGK